MLFIPNEYPKPYSSVAPNGINHDLLHSFNSSLFVIVTEWNQFKNLDLKKIKKLMKKPVILDLRNIYSKEIINNGFQYYSIGNN